MHKFEILDAKKHDLSNFDCGETRINKFLRNDAARKISSGESVTYVLIEENPSPKVIAFYSVASIMAEKERFPNKIKRKFQHSVPVILISWLGVRKDYWGRKIGPAMLFHALQIIYTQMKTIGGAAVIVDPINQKAIDFYVKHGFLKLSEDSTRYFMPAKTVEEFCNSTVQPDATILAVE